MLKFILKFFLICSLIAAILIGGAALYMKLHGKALVQSVLSDMLGFEVRYGSAAGDIDKGSVNFTDVTIADRASPENYFLKIKKLGVGIDKERLIKERAVVIETARLEGAALNVERDESGSFNIRIPLHRHGPGGRTGAYDILRNFKELSITDSRVRFSDSYIARRPAVAIFDGISLQFRSSGAGQNVIRATCSAEARVPSERYASGALALRANMAIYEDRVNLDAQIDAQVVDLAFLCPYINRYTPFIFRGGLFSCAGDLRFYNNRLDSPNTIVFHAIDMSVKPYAENAQFLEASVDKLVPYLESRRGEIIFDFYLTGPLGHITAGVGPRVRNAIGMATMAEMSKIFQQIQRLRY